MRCRLLAAFALTALALVPAAAAQRLSGPVPPGNYTMLDGPKAGQDLYVSANGKGSILDRTTDLRVVEADADCDVPHLHGTIDGKDEPVGKCGWGRVLDLTQAPATIRGVANAVTEEERAIASILAEPPTKLHWELALYGELGIEHALEALSEAEKSGDVPMGPAAKARKLLDEAHKLDETVKKAMSANATTASPTLRQALVRDLRNALSYKREALTIIEKWVLPPAPQCQANKEFEVYPIPAGFTGSYSEVYPHGIPRDAKGIRVRFVDAATGQPVPEELFPGETWTADVKGFRADGALVVRVDITGKGFGKPNEDGKSWRVIVQYDCP
jgi:hypothetical protein